MTKRLSISLACVVLLGLLASSLGCSGGDYRRQMSERVAKLNGDLSKEFGDEFEPPGVRFKLRLPKACVKPLAAGAAARGVTVDEERLAPPKLRLPELKVTYEVFVKTEEGEVPYYCYVGGGEMPRSREIASEISQQLELGFPQVHEGPTDVGCQTRTGHLTRWQFLAGTGELPLLCLDKDGKADTGQVESRCEVYVRREGNYVALIVWRLPKDAADVPSEAVRRKVAGSVVFPPTAGT